MLPPHANDPAAWFRLGNELRQAGRPAAALAALRAADRLTPGHPGVLHATASARADLGQHAAAAAAFAAAAAADPASPHLASDALHLMHYDPAAAEPDLVAAARAWAARHADPLTARSAPHANDRTPGRPLRVGLVSGDLREHPVARLAYPLLAHLDRSAFALTCYDHAKSLPHAMGGPDPNGRPMPRDPTAARLRAIPGVTWRAVPDLTDDGLADLIRADRIDVLVDLAGHMGDHRLLAFARRPAPVQVSHFNYPATTGMAAMDWRVTDDLSEPPGGPHSSYAVERLCRLGPCGWCYDPGTFGGDPADPTDVPPVGPPPALANGHVTFGSLNKPLKHNDRVAATWARVLAAVPGSKLMLLGLADERENVILYEPFAKHGVRRDQVVFAPRRPRPGYLALYGRIDVALDPFPYNGGVTTCDALVMGVPVVALAGTTYRARQGLMLLTNAGLPDLVAGGEDEYVRVAADLAHDLPRLSALRAGLRGRFRACPVMDGPAFVARLGDVSPATHILPGSELN